MRGVNDDAPLSDEEAAALFAPVAGCSRIVLAVSGGPDSTAMMGLFAAWRHAHAGPDALVVTVDHGLRPESAGEASAVAVAAGALGLAAVVLKWTGAKPLTGVQESARDARYHLIGQACAEFGAKAVMLAHTLDDQAETVLMRLARGSGLAGLGGMQVVSQVDGISRIRPFLGIGKARLVATCLARNWPFVRDPSNDSDRFLRPRLRRLMPVLAEEGLSADRLALLANRAARANAVLERVAGAALAESDRRFGGDALDAGVVLAQGPEIAVRLVDKMIRRIQGDGEPSPRLEKIEALAERLTKAISGGFPLHATLGGVKLTLEGGIVRFSAAPPRRSR